MQNRNTLDTILTEVDGKIAWEWVRIITGYHRIKASKGYETIARRIEKRLLEMGLDEVIIHEFPADGETKSWDWTPSYGWDAKSAELWTNTPEKKRICSFQACPLCLVTHSKACDVTGELIDIGTGEPDRLAQDDLAGKLLLFEGWQNQKMKELMSVGALGIISYPTAERIGNENDIHIYDAYLPDASILENLTFGFSLTRNQGLALKKQLSQGKVILYAKIDAKIYPSTLKVIDAKILGTEKPAETILMMGHLCHPSPSANDNASGAAGVLEAVRSLSTLIKNGQLPKPRRTMEFLWVDEYMATIPWTERFQKKLKNALCCINLDMIGENQMKMDSQFYASLAGYSTPSVLNDLILDVVPKIAQDPRGISMYGTKAPMRYTTFPYSGGSDHTVFNDSYFGIPGVMIGHRGDNFYHSSRDDLEMCDPTELQRSIAISLWLGYEMATIFGENLSDMVAIFDNGRYIRKSKLSNLLRGLEKNIKNSTLSEGEKNEGFGFGLELIQAFDVYEGKILNSMDRFGIIPESAKKYTSHIRPELNFWKETQSTYWSSLVKNTGDIAQIDSFKSRYHGAVIGPITFDKMEACEKSEAYKKLAEKVLDDENFGSFTHEIYNLSVVGYTTAQIAALISLEFNHLFYPSKIQLYLDEMVQLQILEVQTDD